jgi:hypothetical protein
MKTHEWCSNTVLRVKFKVSCHYDKESCHSFCHPCVWYIFHFNMFINATICNKVISHPLTLSLLWLPNGTKLSIVLNFLHRKGSLELGYPGWKASVRGSLWQRMSFDWCMLAEWAARDEQPILLTSTNPCITRAAGTQGVNSVGWYIKQNLDVIGISIMLIEWYMYCMFKFCLIL